LSGNLLKPSLASWATTSIDVQFHWCT
jgi:hypothetical protein